MMNINLPNQITLGRLGLVVLLFVLLTWFDAGHLEEQRWVLNVSFWLFVVAALLDVVDGLLARMMKSVTSFGRILDPVVDKTMICGVFLLFASRQFWDAGRNANLTGVEPWMVVVILTRELLVSAVRTHAEAEGREFGASWVGKLKMFVQCVTIGIILAELAWQWDAVTPIRMGCIWATVAVTALSAISYVHRARAFLLTGDALGAPRKGEAP